MIYKQQVFSSTYQIVCFLNDNNIKPEDIITIMPIETDMFLLYNMIYVER